MNENESQQAPGEAQPAPADAAQTAPVAPGEAQPAPADAAQTAQETVSEPTVPKENPTLEPESYPTPKASDPAPVQDNPPTQELPSDLSQYEITHQGFSSEPCEKCKIDTAQLKPHGNVLLFICPVCGSKAILQPKGKRYPFDETILHIEK